MEGSISGAVPVIAEAAPGCAGPPSPPGGLFTASVEVGGKLSGDNGDGSGIGDEGGACTGMGTSK